MPLILALSYLDVPVPHCSLLFSENDSSLPCDFDVPEPGYVLTIEENGRTERLVIAYRGTGGYCGSDDDPYACMIWEPHPVIEELAAGMRLDKFNYSYLRAIAAANPRHNGLTTFLGRPARDVSSAG